MTKSCLRDGTEPAVFVPEVAKQHDVLYSHCTMLAWQFSKYLVFEAFVLAFDWIIRSGNSSSASTKIFRKWHLFPCLTGSRLDIKMMWSWGHGLLFYLIKNKIGNRSDSLLSRNLSLSRKDCVTRPWERLHKRLTVQTDPRGFFRQKRHSYLTSSKK